MTIGILLNIAPQPQRCTMSEQCRCREADHFGRFGRGRLANMWQQAVLQCAMRAANLRQPLLRRCLRERDILAAGGPSRITQIFVLRSILQLTALQDPPYYIRILCKSTILVQC